MLGVRWVRLDGCLVRHEVMFAQVKNTFVHTSVNQ